MAGKQKPIRWTVEKASMEFGVHRRTITQRIREAGIEAGEDGKYSTRDIADTIYGSLGAERLGKTRAERELLEIELGKERRDLIPSRRVYSLLEDVFVSVKMKILGSSMSEVEQDKLLVELSRLKNGNGSV